MATNAAAPGYAAAEEEFPAEEHDLGEGELETDGAAGADNHDEVADAQQELELMKERLAHMEAEAAKLRETQAKASEEASAPQTPGSSAAEADSRSIHVSQVDYGCSPEELQVHFQGCGTVNRVTILTDKFGNAKGYAYIEFLEADAVPSALLLDGSELRGRQLKVNPKRTNIPYMSARGRGRGPFRGGFRGRGRGGYSPYGYAPRGRGRGRGYYSPY